MVVFGVMAMAAPVPAGVAVLPLAPWYHSYVSPSAAVTLRVTLLPLTAEG